MSTKPCWNPTCDRCESTEDARPRDANSEPRTSILEDAIAATHGDRRASYGHPLDHFARTIGAINAQFTDVVRARLAADKPMLEPEDWPKFMILDKLSRSMEAYRRDSMLDVAGYAQTHEWVIEERGRRRAFSGICEAAVSGRRDGGDTL